MEAPPHKSSSPARFGQQRLVPWLRRRLEKNDIPGLEWEDKERQIWKLPWKEKRVTKWGDPDAYMLKKYAVALQDSLADEVPSQEQLKHWKMLLRNSLLSMKKDFKELKEHHNRDADIPYKVYRFIGGVSKKGEGDPSTSRHQANLRRQVSAHSSTRSRTMPSAESSSSGDIAEFSRHVPPDHLLPTICLAEPQVDSVSLPRLEEMTGQFPGIGSPYQSQFQEICTPELPPALTNNIQLTMMNKSQRGATWQGHGRADFLANFGDDMSENSVNALAKQFGFPSSHNDTGSGFPSASGNSYRSRSPVHHGESEQDDQSSSYRSATNGIGASANSMLSLPDGQSAEFFSLSQGEDHFEDALMTIVVYYFNHCVMREWISHRKFRVCFVPDAAHRESIMTCPNDQKFGPRDASLIELPLVQACKLTREESQKTQKVLNDIERGFMIEYTAARDIQATRYCKRVPFFHIPDYTRLEKLRRDGSSVKVFDFNNILRIFSDQNYPFSALSPFVRFTFYHDEPEMPREEAIKIEIWHMETLNKKRQALEHPCPNGSINSLSDEFDQHVKIEHNLRHNLT